MLYFILGYAEYITGCVLLAKIYFYSKTIWQKGGYINGQSI